MPFVDQLWFYLLAAVVAGLVVGIFLGRILSGRHTQNNDVRWKRRLRELQIGHESSTATLTKTLRHAQEKQATLRAALDESDETVRLLSADRVPVHEEDIARCNRRIAELEKRLSHARASLADAEDEENTLKKQVDQLQSEQLNKNKNIDELSAELSRRPKEPVSLVQSTARTDAVKHKPVQTGHSVARVISIHEHLDRPPPHSKSPAAADGTEQRIRILEDELQQWKRKYETARKNEESFTSDVLLRKRSHQTGTRRDNLKLIRGIGPVLETQLNQLGFYQFQQLARMGQNDIEQLARHDRSLPGRINRYQWVEQAKRLQQTQTTDGHNPDV